MGHCNVVLKYADFGARQNLHPACHRFCDLGQIKNEDDNNNILLYRIIIRIK